MKRVEIVGAGCRSCALLRLATEEAIEALGVDACVEKVEDVAKMAESGVYMMPALVIDGKVKVQGRIPSKRELEQILS